MNEAKIYYIKVYGLRLKTVFYICPIKFLFDTKIFFTVFFISKNKQTSKPEHNPSAHVPAAPQWRGQACHHEHGSTDFLQIKI